VSEDVMAKKSEIIDDDIDMDDEMIDDPESFEYVLDVAGYMPDARRRLEQLREERELERLINSSDYDY